MGCRPGPQGLSEMLTWASVPDSYVGLGSVPEWDSYLGLSALLGCRPRAQCPGEEMICAQVAGWNAEMGFSAWA